MNVAARPRVLTKDRTAKGLPVAMCAALEDAGHVVCFEGVEV